MDQRGRLVAMRGVPTMLGLEESVTDTGLRSEHGTVHVWTSLLEVVIRGMILHVATKSRVVQGVLKTMHHA